PCGSSSRSSRISLANEPEFGHSKRERRKANEKDDRCRQPLPSFLSTVSSPAIKGKEAEFQKANGKGNEFRKAATSSGLKLLAFFAAVRVAHYAMNRPR
ncbi:unnamed protein product, partial [Ectocarpus sp. 12 AP-2014]